MIRVSQQLYELELGIIGYITTSANLFASVEQFLAITQEGDRSRTSGFFAEEHPRLTRGALLVGFYALFELALERLCKEILDSHFNSDLGSVKKKYHSRGKVYYLRKYLCENVELKIPVFFQESGKIELLRITRNSFAHNLGIVQDKDWDDFKRLRQRNDFNGSLFVEDDTKTLVLSSKFLHNVQYETAEAFDQLITQVRIKIQGRVREL